MGRIAGERLSDWVENNQGKHVCACGCEEKINIIPDHRKRGITKYILGHNARGNGNPSYKGVDIWIKENQGKIKCGCGCGEIINLKYWHFHRPTQRFVHGHNGVGELAHNWQGGISKYDATRNSGQIRRWRKKVLIRDHYRCQMPGCINPTNPNIQAHHIIAVRIRESLSFDINNGIALCGPCHYGIKNKEEQYENFFFSILDSINGE